MDKVLSIFTSEDKEEIKQAIKEIIIEQVRNDFENNDLFLVDPYAIENMVEEVIEEVKDEVRVIYKEKLMKEMEEKLGL